MSNSTVRAAARILLVALLAAAVLGCASKPKTPEPVEPEQPQVAEQKPPEQKPPAEVPPPVEVAPVEPPPVVEVAPVEPAKPAPLSDEELAGARSAIARAEEADADYFAPELLQQARKALQEAVRLRAADPDGARRSAGLATGKADEAFRVAVEKNGALLTERLQRAQQKLIDQHAPEFLPDEYAAATAGVGVAGKLYKEGRLAEARDEAYATLKQMSDLSDRLDERIRWVQLLRRDTHQYLGQAEELQAHLRAPLEYQRASRLYEEGVESFQTWKLSESEDSLGRAREAALNAIRLSKSKAAEEKEEVDRLMLEVMEELEAASALTVVTEDGLLVEPAPWTGEPFIEEEQAPDVPEGSSFLLPIPADGGVAVLGNEEQQNLLEQAKEVWKKGVEERNQGRYKLAAEYFQEARQLLEVFKTQAVNPVTPLYVVRLIPERRDCLWRIAEYDYVYGNPYLWPKIWRRNRKLIQHPDLIHPGWKLVIPPQ